MFHKNASRSSSNNDRGSEVVYFDSGVNFPWNGTAFVSFILGETG